MAFHKRSTYLINPKFQIRFCLFVALIVFISSIIYPFTIYEVIDGFISYIGQNSPDVATSLKEKRKSLIYILSLWQLGFTALVFVVCIFISHKIAGPMYKLQKFLSEVREGHGHGKLFFRKGDYFHEVAEDINQTFSEIEEQHKQDAAYLDEVRSYIDNLAMVVPENKQSVLKEISKKLIEIQTRFNQN